MVETKKTPLGNATTIIEFRNLKINTGLSDDLFEIPKSVEFTPSTITPVTTPVIKPKSEPKKGMLLR